MYTIRKIYYAFDVLSRIFRKNKVIITCPCCGYHGRFDTFGIPPRYGALCPQCQSLERHRLIALTSRTRNFFIDKDVLHFAPETVLSRIIYSQAKQYTTADLIPGRADIVLNCEKIDQPDESWDVIACFHVLEHVNDHLALQEFYRILRKRGELLVMAPVIEGWDTTYENPNIVTKKDRELHFGQHDHVRIYGRDIRNRLENAGFEFKEYTAYGDDCVKYGLIRGDKIFVCMKRE
jgi:SAM-dependent methyltransferase